MATCLAWPAGSGAAGRARGGQHMVRSSRGVAATQASKRSSKAGRGVGGGGRGSHTLSVALQAAGRGVQAARHLAVSGHICCRHRARWSVSHVGTGTAVSGMELRLKPLLLLQCEALIMYLSPLEVSMPHRSSRPLVDTTSCELLNSTGCGTQCEVTIHGRNLPNGCLAKVYALIRQHDTNHLAAALCDAMRACGSAVQAQSPTVSSHLG